MDCKLKHTYEVYDEGSHNTGMYRGSSAEVAAGTLRPLAHSDDFRSGAFVMATHPDRTFCLEAVKHVQDRATEIKCKHCKHVIRQNGMEAGGSDRAAAKVWGTTMEHDPNDGHPWYCGSNPSDSKKHEPGH